MIPIEAAVAALFGSLYGSFLNVVIHRLPREESVVSPRSRCPHCGKPIAAKDNLPVVSWLLLRGRGRCCRKPISARYPAVEAAMALLAGGLFARWPGDPVFAAGAALACGALLALALIDWDTFLIPDELSGGLVLSGLLFCFVNPYLAAPGAPWWEPLWFSVRGAGLGFLLGWGVAVGGEALFGQDAFGGGDVKLLAGIGAWTGGTGAFDALMIGSTLGSVYGVWLLKARRAKRTDPIPFGPFLAAAAAFGFFKLLPFGWPFVP
ncbi:MAG: prepilin peptidase [Elusimicrobiota bacterium]|nr:MAG: prepilin peptidase [Elusimicrobiota bacterium]